MQIGFTYSLILHIALLLVLMFGVDYSRKISQQEETILLEMVQISTITNVKTTTNDVKPLDVKKEMVSKDEVKKDSKTVLKDSEFDNQNVSQKKIEEKTEPKHEKKPEPEPMQKEVKQQEEAVANHEKVPTKEQKKPEQKKIEKDKPAEKEIQKIEKKVEKKQDKPKPDKKKSADDDLANAVLKSLQEGGKKSSKSNKTQSKSLNDIMENAIKGDTTSEFDAHGDLSMSEIAAIRSQISQSWRVTSFSGGKDNKNMRVIVRVRVEQDGDVSDVKVIEKSVPVGVNMQIYNAFVDSVIRAVRAASPLHSLPQNKYDTWSDMELTFDSSGMIY